MKKHKWKDTTVLTNITKSQECVNCGITRSWCYGDYQCWEYYTHTAVIVGNGSGYYSTKSTFKRPDCKGKIISVRVGNEKIKS